MQLNKNRPEYAKQCHCMYCVNFLATCQEKLNDPIPGQGVRYT